MRSSPTSRPYNRPPVSVYKDSLLIDRSKPKTVLCPKFKFYVIVQHCDDCEFANERNECYHPERVVTDDTAKAKELSENRKPLGPPEPRKGGKSDARE